MASEKKEEEPITMVIQIDPTLVINDKGDQADMSFDASSAGFTTGRPRAELHSEKMMNANLLKETQTLAAMLGDQETDDRSVKTTKSTTDRLAQALEQIELTKIAQKDLRNDSSKIISPNPNRQAPVNQELTGTKTDSVGDKDELTQDPRQCCSVWQYGS
jgi:hypothetical protein